MALNDESPDAAYNLGRLFAVYEYAEQGVAKRNAIDPRQVSSARLRPTPRRVFPILMRGYEHNASALAKGEGNQRGTGVKAAKAVSQILGLFDGDVKLPTALRLEDQGRFFVGYYHQNKALFTKTERAESNPDHRRHRGSNIMTALAEPLRFRFLLRCHQRQSRTAIPTPAICRAWTRRPVRASSPMCRSSARSATTSPTPATGQAGHAIYVTENAILNDQHRKAYKVVRPDD